MYSYELDLGALKKTGKLDFKDNLEKAKGAHDAPFGNVRWI